MKKTLTGIILAAAVLITACGCEKENTEATTTTTAAVTTTTTAAETTAATTEAATTETTTAETAAAETTTTETAQETEIPTGTDTDLESTLVVGTGLIQNSKKGDGFVSYDRAAISEDIAASGMTEKALDKETVLADYELYGNNIDNIYTFAMISTDGVQEYPSDSSSVIMTVFVLDNVGYTVSFGTGEKVTLEDALPYCTAGKYIEYWAFATVSGNGNVILMPFIAGSETNGYYLVQPVMEMMNADISEMYLPQPVGDDYYATEPTETEAPETETPDVPSGSAVLNITSVENLSGMSTLNITMMNKYDVPLYFSGESIIINGVDYSDSFTAFFHVEANGSTDDFIFITCPPIGAGDVIEVTFSLQNAETFEDFGTITFPLTLENTYTYA